jgi:Ethanolamine utilization protein EutJ (predicted chaperonin)
MTTIAEFLPGGTHITAYFAGNYIIAREEV